MRIISYNINGIRAAINKGLTEWLATDPADIICFQEVKAFQDNIDSTIIEKLGYHIYWFAAQKKGYSGVAVFTKIKPKQVILGNGYERSDNEGRVLQLIFENFYLINTYFPSGSSGEERQQYKMLFLEEYITFLQPILEKYKNVIVVGDYNICHRAIDIHDPIGNKNSSGFLPEERRWMDQFFALGFIDTFRHLHFAPDHYSWWSYRANARANNKGWRIDYISISENLKSHLAAAKILPEIVHSDHCPVYMEIAI